MIRVVTKSPLPTNQGVKCCAEMIHGSGKIGENTCSKLPGMSHEVLWRHDDVEHFEQQKPSIGLAIVQAYHSFALQRNDNHDL